MSSTSTVEQATGWVLRKRLLTETSLIVHWLTAEQGRVATVAKGARRPKSPYRGKLDLFYLADFIASYYRCPIGDTYAAILPAGLLRADGEVAQLTPSGAAADPSALPARQGAVLAELQETGRLGVPSLLARAGAASRSPLDALISAGHAKIRRRRRDRPPEAEVTAVKLPEEPISDLLDRCRRAPRRREVLEWLAEQGRPAFASEVCFSWRQVSPSANGPGFCETTTAHPSPRK